MDQQGFHPGIYKFFLAHCGVVNIMVDFNKTNHYASLLAVASVVKVGNILYWRMKNELRLFLKEFGVNSLNWHKILRLNGSIVLLSLFLANLMLDIWSQNRKKKKKKPLLWFYKQQELM